MKIELSQSEIEAIVCAHVRGAYGVRDLDFLGFHTEPADYVDTRGRVRKGKKSEIVARFAVSSSPRVQPDPAGGGFPTVDLSQDEPPIPREDLEAAGRGVRLARKS